MSGKNSSFWFYRYATHGGQVFPMRIAAIVNPVSGLKTARKNWPALLHSLAPGATGVETFWSRYPGHAELLAASARRSGYDRVIAVGGDGTLFEILNGLWWEQGGELPSVGMVPLGTGCDYIRNFEVGRGRFERLRAAVSQSTITVSLGRCRTQNAEGRCERVFAMILGMGLDAEVIRRFRTGRFGRAGWPAYAMSALRAFSSLKSHALSGSMNGSSFHTNAIFLGAALGCCFGKRLLVAPAASPVRKSIRAGLGRAGWISRVAIAGLSRLFWVALQESACQSGARKKGQSGLCPPGIAPGRRRTDREHSGRDRDHTGSIIVRS